ncbi:MAG: 50S ribosomal protein L10 [Clostridiales bacterium]|nr:50S ribosomal protein L10 [Clostridiales bacterium]
MPNKKVLASKKKTVKDLAALMQSAKIGVLVDYRGLTVAEDTELRNKFRAEGVKYSVIKNTMARLAIKGIGLEELEPVLSGPTSLATGDSDLIAPARILFDFAKDNEAIEIKGGFLEGKVVDANVIKRLASLPPKEVLIAKMLGSMNAPVSGLVNVLNANITGLVRVLGQIRDKAA